jgi:hypothetical protein
MAQEVVLDRRASIGDAEEEIWWVDRDLMGRTVDVDVDEGTVLDGNFGMMGHLVKAHRYPVRLVHSYVEMRADAWAGDRSREVVGMDIGMVLDYGCRRHSAGVAEPAGNKTKMVRGAHMAVVGSS